MPTEIPGPVFALNVGTDPDAGVVRLRLTDEHDRQLGAHQVRLAEHKAALWQGLFDAGVRADLREQRALYRPAGDGGAGLLLAPSLIDARSDHRAE